MGPGGGWSTPESVMRPGERSSKHRVLEGGEEGGQLLNQSRGQEKGYQNR